MSRVSELQRLCIKDISSDFSFAAIQAPPIHNFLSFTDTQDLAQIATSIKYNANIDKKYKLIDQIMVSRGFRKAHAGTNRVVYNFLEWPAIVGKIAIDRVGIRDNPAEFKNQWDLQPYCCKVHDVDETGVAAIVERVNPISSIEEFASIWEDIFYLITNKIVGKKVVDDIGVSYFMNYGIRNGFGPVILDFPYVFDLDGRKLICNKDVNTPFGMMKCGGEIDYTGTFDEIRCTKCGRVYQAKELELDKKDKIFIMEGDCEMTTRVRVMRGDTVISDSSASSPTYVTKDQMESLVGGLTNREPGTLVKVAGTKYKRKGQDEVITRMYNKRNKRGPKIAKLNEEADEKKRAASNAGNGIQKVSYTVSSSGDINEPEVAHSVVKAAEVVAEAVETVDKKITEAAETILNATEQAVEVVTTNSEYPNLTYDETINGKLSYKMIEENGWSIDNNGKVRHKGHFVSKGELRRCIFEHETEEAHEQSEEAIDVSGFKIGGDVDHTDDENKYDGYEVPDYNTTEDDSDAVDMNDYADQYKEDKKAAKRQSKKKASNKDMSAY